MNYIAEETKSPSTLVRQHLEDSVRCCTREEDDEFLFQANILVGFLLRTTTAQTTNRQEKWWNVDIMESSNFEGRLRGGKGWLWHTQDRTVNKALAALGRMGVSGDGFWARDMTFENTAAGPQKHQAVALRVNADLGVFYRCSFKAYQDTLFVHSLRQFYRDCHIYGTIDFIFGDAPVVLQNCDICIRRPMRHQANMITAQGRDSPHENTGICIQGSRVRASPEFVPVKNSFKSYLGRPWKKDSRTVFIKTDLDGLIDPKGWTEWDGSYALSTLYYAEYMNTGAGAATQGRVTWPGFHVLKSTRISLI
ncbi:putative pectinesterase/pectinesterase inhibitor 36 [Turnera subulata]|uniref:Pectinesterase n=1 Tax=Turnera subulata TaxID=218843 RepID=A0A9Q0FZG2_9ROSI|nr:putative pectinesterase/pectinesterase inhibitor 36 [Turnera subulata]